MPLLRREIGLLTWKEALTRSEGIATSASGLNGACQLHTEIHSADRIDLVMAFVRRSGIAPLLEALRAHCARGRSLRILTTTYTGSTEAAALDALQALGGQIRISYDTSTTRLHAKAWLFHRRSGFSTAYIGSSNLTHSAKRTASSGTSGYLAPGTGTSSTRSRRSSRGIRTPATSSPTIATSSRREASLPRARMLAWP